MDGTPHHEGALGRGVYDARRAAALAGIPQSTLHYWARHGIYRPSISPEPRTRLWSWLDLLALRALDWLRKNKGVDEPPAISARRLRRGLEELDKLDIPRVRLNEFLAVSRSRNELLITLPGTLIRAESGGQIGMGEVLEVVKPYDSGPDLLQPRPMLRIIPGKLHGEPHLTGTRIPSAAIFALYQDGYTIDQIRAMYPDAQERAIYEAIDLERSLSGKAA